jgi:hypothetical protein
MPKKPAASSRGGAAALAVLLLGDKARVSALPNVSLDLLLLRTREQLSEAARRLGLSGLGRPPKEDLARRVREALRRLTPAGRAASSPSVEAGAARGKSRVKAPRQRRPAGVPASRRVAGARPRAAKKGEEPEPETGARSKFDLGSRAQEPRPAEHIPWGYGQNRITTLVVDPRRMYAYWEVRDDTIEAARKALGPGGRDAWLNLRVYDVSGRIFDGTNAHSYFDVKVERHTRQWFFEIGKPTSTHCVEIGLKSHEGYFVKIARAGRVDFPRAEPWAPGPVEWLSVHEITGEIGAPTPGAPPAHAGAPAIPHPAPPSAPAHPPGTWAEGEYWVVSDTSAFREWALLSGWESHDFLETEWIGGHGRLEWLATGQRFEWVGPVVHTMWEAGPFPVPIEAPGLVEERHDGPVIVQKAGDKTRVIYGPWEVVIRGIGGRAEGRVLSRWEVRKSWVSDVGFEVVGGAVRWRALAPEERAARPPGSSEGLLAGASERRWLMGSEVRLAGASEVFRVGASEFRYLGASETLFAGASERRYRGASEFRLRGASERLARGASERLYPGASERLGASERRLGGASEGQMRSRHPTKVGVPRKR